MDGDLENDIDELVSSIDKAEVMSIFFPALRKSVILDMRSTDEEGAFVRIVSMAASPQERMRSIRRLRPRLPRVRNITVIPWPRYVDSLVNLGVWDRIVNRFRELGHQEAADKCSSVLEELKQMEKRELISVVKGENYHTIWSAAR